MLISIIIPCYNSEKTISECLKSLTNQTYKNIEIICINDGSTDNTLKICQEYTAQYPDLFKLITQPVNTKGQHVRWAMNKEIQTPYFTIIEGDDYWINENHIEKAISFFEKQPDYNMYASNVYYKKGSFQKDSCEYQNLAAEKIGYDISFENYIYLQTSGRVYRKIFDFNQFPIQTIEGDIFMYYLYLDKGKSYFDHEVDSVYRISETGAWNKLTSEEKSQAFYDVVYKATKLLNFRHAKFLLKQLPKCKIKKLRKFIGNKFALRFFVLWYYLKQKGHVINDNSNYIKIIGPINKKKIQIKLDGRNNCCLINTDKILPTAKINISVYGDNNLIIIDENFYLSSRLNILIGQNHPNFGKANNSIFHIDKNSSVESMSYLTFNSNSHCYIGKECMISFNVTLYNTDAHPILDLKTKRIANHVRGIIVGDHVWLGQNSTILKNSLIASDCICGMGSVVCGKFAQPHCIMAGNPARVVKENRTWDSNGSKGYIQNEG